MTDKEKFDAGMDAILKANPAAVRAQMEAEKRERDEERQKKKEAQ